MYEHARLCIAINFKIEYWLLPKLAKGIRELYMIVSIPWHLGLNCNFMKHNNTEFSFFFNNIGGPFRASDWKCGLVSTLIEFGDVSLDVVEAILVCPAESVSPHELVHITVVPCMALNRPLHLLQYDSMCWVCMPVPGSTKFKEWFTVRCWTPNCCWIPWYMHTTGPNWWRYRVQSRSGWSAEELLHLVCWPFVKIPLLG